MTNNEILRELAKLTDEQEESLGEALDEVTASAHWSSSHCRQWLFQEAVRRGYLMGPA